MADLSHAVDEALLRDLECPVCTEYMVPPIKLCINGHNICSKCRGKVECCPTCRAEFTKIRNVTLESIVRRLKYPCANRESGCLDLFSIEHIAKHQAACTYGPIKCPLNKVNMKCPWKGLKSDLEQHAKAAHGNCFLTSPTIPSPLLNNEVALVFCLGEVFLYNKVVTNEETYCVVQLIGPHSEASKYKCEFKLQVANNIEKISKTFTVRCYEEHFERSLRSGKCFRLKDEIVTNFYVEGRLNLTITLSKVE